MSKKDKNGLIRTAPTPEREKAIQEAYERDMAQDDLNLHFEEYILTKIGKQPNHPDSKKRWDRLRTLAKLVFLNKSCSYENLFEWASQKWSGIKQRTFNECYLGHLHQIGTLSWDRSSGSVYWLGRPAVQFKVKLEYKEDMLHA